MAEETTRPNEFKRIQTDFVKMVTTDPKKTTFLVCKVIEVILCDIAIGLSDYPFYDTKIRRHFLNNFTNIGGAIVFTSFYGYTLINVILVISHILGEQLPKKMLMLFSSFASVLCCIAGIILIVELNSHEDEIIPSEHLELLLPSGICAILAALTFALDSMLTYKYA